MDEVFFMRPWVWALAVCMVGLVLLARCEAIDEYDPYAWQGAQPDGADGYAMEVYEYEMVENSLPPTGNWE